MKYPVPRFLLLLLIYLLLLLIHLLLPLLHYPDMWQLDLTLTRSFWSNREKIQKL